MDSCNAPETQERKQPWEVRHEVRSLGSLRVDGVDGHRLPFRRLGELALMMEAHWDTGRKPTGLQWSPAERSPRRQMRRVETCVVVARGGEI